MQFLRKFGRSICRILPYALCGLPIAVDAQSTSQPVMRMVCFDAAETTNGESTGGWTIIVTQQTSELHPAETFIPDDDGQYAEKFPMFENITFFVSVFPVTAGVAAPDNLPAFSDALLVSQDAPPWIIAEGNRVGTLLDIGWGDSNRFKYDSADQTKNAFLDNATGDERTPICQKPFEYVIPGSG